MESSAGIKRLRPHGVFSWRISSASTYCACRSTTGIRSATQFMTSFCKQGRVLRHDSEAGFASNSQLTHEDVARFDGSAGTVRPNSPAQNRTSANKAFRFGVKARGCSQFSPDISWCASHRHHFSLFPIILVVEWLLGDVSCKWPIQFVHYI